MKRKLFLTSAVFFLLMSNQVLAASHQETEVINHVGTGDVSICLEELEHDSGGREIPYVNNKVVLPGQKTEKIVRITNRAEPAWVRAKLEYTSYDGIQGLSDQMVTVGADGWRKAGTYYYYTKPLGTGESVDFIKEVRIPPEWDQKESGRSFSILVTADAVQEAHFTPDFSGDDPWFGTLIETCVHTAYEAENGGAEAFLVAFEGGAEGLVRLGEDFFSNWGHLMPGDVAADRVQVKNCYSHPVRIYFRTETIADDFLLKALRLEIKCGEEILYSGTMDGSTGGKRMLAFLKPGDEKALIYKVRVPEELNNRYAMAETKTKWIFSAEIGGSEETDRGSSSEGAGGRGWSLSGANGTVGNYGPGGPEEMSDFPRDLVEQIPAVIEKLPETLKELPAAVSNLPKEVLKLPKTGEGMEDFWLFLLFLFSGAGAMILWRTGKKEEHHE